MIQTSYFANHKHFPSGKELVSISLYTPSWFSVPHKTAKELNPSPSLLKAYKDGEISVSGYIDRYVNETLSKLDPKEIYHRYNNTVFLCYETSDEFCHRQIVSEWLRSYGYNIEEAIPKDKKITVAVVGTRGFSDFEYFKNIIDKLVSNYDKSQIQFSSGGAKSGADHLIKIYAEKYHFPLVEFLPKWDKHGKAAGFIRNEKIWAVATLGIMFWDGESKGTAHSLSIADKQNKKLYVVRYDKSQIYTQFPHFIYPDLEKKPIDTLF